MAQKGFFGVDFDQTPVSTIFGVIRPTAFFVYNEARPRERSDRGRFLPSGKKASS